MLGDIIADSRATSPGIRMLPVIGFGQFASFKIGI